MICNIQVSADSKVPSSSDFVMNEGSAQNTNWGVATSGVLLFNAISGEGADPFYPVATASDPDATAEKVDWC